MSESLFSNKLNKSSRNQLYVYSRKPRARINVKDAGSRAQIRHEESDLRIFADYRHISTNNGDVGKAQFSKRIRFPNNFFEAGAMPIVFYSLEYQGDVVHKILPIVKNPNATSFVVQAQSQSPNVGTFDANMDYFLNYIVIGASGTVSAPYSYDTPQFLPVDWGADDEQLRVSSLALNQMSENTDYLYHNRVLATMTNIDYPKAEPNFYVRYLNNKLLMYGKYEEFNPSNDIYDKNDSTDDASPKKFVREFEFPQNLFSNTAHPMVIANVGPKVNANTADANAIKQLSCILKEVRIGSFALEIWEMSQTQEFASNDTYFVSYIVIGEKAGDD